jgi:glycosyltransferase 2 family protein
MRWLAQVLYLDSRGYLMKRIWFLIRILISVGLIAILIYAIDFREITASLVRGNIQYILIAFLIAMGDRVIMAYKWGILLKAKDIHIPLLNLTGTYLVSTFLGLFLPATVGADAVRAYAVSKDGHKAKDVISSIIVERLLGIIALLVFVVFAIIFSIYVFGQTFFVNIWGLFWIVLALLLFLIGLLVVTSNKMVLKFAKMLLYRWNEKFSRYKLVGKLKEIYQSYLTYQDRRADLVMFLLFSFIENLFPIFSSYFLSLAFGVNISLLYFFILIPIVLVLVRLPISIDGIGIQEGAFVYFLTLIGVSRADALLLGIASHIMAIISVLPGGVLYGLSGLGVRKRMDIPKADVQEN